MLTDSIGDRDIWRRPAISKGFFLVIGGLCCVSCNTRRCSTPRLPTVAVGRPDELGAPVGEREGKRVERRLSHMWCRRMTLLRHHMCERRSPGGSRLPLPRETSPSL